MKDMNGVKIIAVDQGYGNIKTANHCFPTGILPCDGEPLFGADTLVYDGKYYLIGEGHKEFLPDKVKDDDYYLLTLAAIACELSDAHLTQANVLLAVGLPLTWSGGQKVEFAAYLGREETVRFTYRKTDYCIHIAGVKVYPQGYAAVAQIKSQMTGVNMIADIGNGTMNVLYIVGGKPQAGRMFTEKFGVHQCTLAVRKAFMRRTQRELDDAIINEVFRTGAAGIKANDLAIIRAAAGVNDPEDKEMLRQTFEEIRKTLRQIFVAYTGQEPSEG